MSYTPLSPDELTWMRRDTLASLIQTITFELGAGITGNGEKSYGPVKTYHARIQQAAQTAIYTSSGEMVVSKQEVVFYPVATDATTLTTLGPYPDDGRITFPDGTQPRILSIAPSYDGLGIWLWTVRT
jgi:hypothetical protein